MAAIVSASAMSYSQAREQAWFLTDKMAYELYLTNAQVEAVYEINLDYIMNVDVRGDLYGIYWERRNRELGFVLTNSQMHTFLASTYFYRPISWVSNSFYFTIYDRYPRAHFYATAPRVYTTYRGEYRNSTGNRFEGKFGNDKPAVTNRTLSTRTGATVTGSGAGFTNPGTSTINNGRNRPSGTTTTPTTSTTTNRPTGSTSRPDNKVTTNSSEPKVITPAVTGSVRTGSTATQVNTGTASRNTIGTAATVGSSRTSSSTTAGTANNGTRRH